MTRYAAFLRGVNLGKRTVKSAELKAAFEELGYGGVKTLLASGNVLFDADGVEEKLRAAIEAGLKKQFGFEVGALLRTRDELQAMIDADPFAGVDPNADVNFPVLMLTKPLSPAPRLESIAGDYDVARIDPRDVYFVVHKKPDGTYTGHSALGQVDKLFPKGTLITMRNWNTILKAAA